MKTPWIFTLLMMWPLLGNAQPYGQGTLVVLNKSDHTLSLISLATGEEEALLEVGRGPHEVAVSPSAKWAVVTNYGPSGEPGNSLSVVDVATRKVVRTLSLGEYQRPHGIEFVQENKVVVTAETQQALLLVNIQSGKVEKVMHTGQQLSHMVVVDARHQRAFTANIGSGSVTVIDLKKGKKIKDIATGQGAEGIDISPDGTEVWVTNRSENTLSIISTQRLEVVHTLPAGNFPIRVKFTPDGKWALVSNAKAGEVAVYEVSSRRLSHSINIQENAAEDVQGRLSAGFGDGPIPIGILIHPSGTHAFIANTNADIVTVIRLDTWEVAGRIFTRSEPDGLGYIR
jgi:YVTN family beta-propeller protein